MCVGLDCQRLTAQSYPAAPEQQGHLGLAISSAGKEQDGGVLKEGDIYSLTLACTMCLLGSAKLLTQGQETLG